MSNPTATPTIPTPPAAGGARYSPYVAGGPLSAPLPQRVLVAPHGEVVSTNGSFVVDDDAMNATIAAFIAHGTDLPIDFEHQSLGGAYSAPNGLAPAAGWIKALHAVRPTSDGNAAVAAADAGATVIAESTSSATPADGVESSTHIDGAAPRPGLWAEVEWTPLAAEHLLARQYRYLSPVALVRRADRRMVGLHSVALTNKPAIVGMEPVVARDGLAATALPAAAGEWADARAPAGGVAELRTVLGVSAEVDDAHVLVAAAQRLRGMQEVLAAQAAHARVERAARSGRLAPAQREWALSLATSDPAAFEAWLASAPQIVPLGRMAAPSQYATEGAAAARARTARHEYRSHQSMLSALCSEEAFVADALRQEGLTALPTGGESP